MRQSDQQAVELGELLPEERYTLVLEQWKSLSERQIAALEGSDWAAFERLIERKSALMQAWEAHPVDLASLAQRAHPDTRRRWQHLTQDALQLDKRLERIVTHLIDEVKRDQRDFGERRRVARAYRALPPEFTPSFHDRKY